MVKKKSNPLFHLIPKFSVYLTMNGPYDLCHFSWCTVIAMVIVTTSTNITTSGFVIF